MPRKINIKNKQNKDKNLYAYHSQTAKNQWQRENLNLCIFLKSHLGDLGSQDEMQNVTEESKCIMNVWNNFIEESGGIRCQPK